MSIAKHNERILTWSEARWNEWETMHDNVLWFDTAGCLDGGFIGEVNSQHQLEYVQNKEKIWEPNYIEEAPPSIGKYESIDTYTDKEFADLKNTLSIPNPTEFW